MNERELDAIEYQARRNVPKTSNGTPNEVTIFAPFTPRADETTT